MSDKSRDAEPSHDDVVPGEPDATDIHPGAHDGAALEVDSHDDAVEIDDPEALADAEADVMEMDDDDTLVGDDDAIAQMEEQFDAADPDQERTPAIVRRTAKAPVRKAAPTKRRKDAVADAEDHYKASTPIEFVKQSGAELTKVVWPTWPQLVTMFFAVLVFVLIIIAIVGGLDVLFGWILLSLFGN